MCRLLFVYINLSEELGLKHESRGNWRSKTLYIYKDTLNIPFHRNSQVTSAALTAKATVPQQNNPNVMAVIASGASQAESASAQPKRRSKKPCSNAIIKWNHYDYRNPYDPAR